ncbi:ribonuclease III [Kordiimonas sp. SCSIO 12610]|uniref:ribonuclease III n=1 Tax=Kordiimonas sp. SCSIO 12610 TaxID=2829597 RepID=UPI00210CC6CE|nr:ribonuclease III [Kordiimonas sp. SCSIO 12610]UTW56670.1 ribonuclease III [Kordiimonas sp. SCSIO 12610]
MTQKIQKKVADYTFNKVSLLEEALTHPSLSGRHNYQRLEFLGDRVLGLIISDWLLDLYPSEDEGQLNQRFSALVRRETLAEMSRNLKIVDLILLAPGAEQEGTRDKDAIQCDVCEAVIGAIYLDGGFDAANTFVRTHWKEIVGKDVNAFKDAKTLLQEWCQARNLPLPRYNVLSRSGPDHNPVFNMQAEVEGVNNASAEGPAKRFAEQAAAAALMEKLAANS